MESKTEHWVFAFVIALVTHAGLVAALVVAWPSGTLPNPRSVGPDLTSSSGTAPIRVQLLGSLLRTELLHSNAPSEPSEMLTKAHPRRARISTLKAKTDEVAAAAHAREGPANSNSRLGENGSPEFTAADDRPGACCSDDRTGARFPVVESRGSEAGAQASGEASDRVVELHRRLAESAQRCYPSTARRLRLRGEVGLHFCLSEQGRVSVASLRGSTGSALLDAAARECVLAGALPAPGIAGCYDVPIKFSDRE